MTLASARIFVPRSFFAREGVDHNVGPTVAIKIVGEREEIIGVSVIDAERAFEAREVFFGAISFLAFESRIGGIELVAVGEAGSFIPIRTGDDVVNPVFIEIAESRAFSPELVYELIFGEGMKDVFGSGNCRSEKEKRK